MSKLIKYLPNCITLASIVFGISSIPYSLASEFNKSIFMIVIASIIDWLDGYAARALKATSLFGAQLDSFADLLNFGVAPAFLMHLWSIENYGTSWWGFYIFYLICITIRLARFNTTKPKKIFFFEGVPSTIGAVILVIPSIIYNNHSIMNNIDLNINQQSIMLINIIISLMLITNIPTYSIKNIPQNRLKLFFICTSPILGIITINPLLGLIIIVVLYILSIPISYIHNKIITSRENNIQ